MVEIPLPAGGVAGRETTASSISCLMIDKGHDYFLSYSCQHPLSALTSKRVCDLKAEEATFNQ
ncbi:MAG TPA: hypothetical protein VGA96_09860, partial [Fibrella sp.]